MNCGIVIEKENLLIQTQFHFDNMDYDMEFFTNNIEDFKLEKISVENIDENDKDYFDFDIIL
jgi:hypothetical protein